MSIDEDQDFASDEASTVDSPRSQFTLLDIMVGVTIAAVTCGVWLQYAQPQIQMIQIVLMVPTLIVFVLGGTTLFSFGRRYVLKQPIDFQPGHWLLCLMGVTFVVQSTTHVLRLAIIPSHEVVISDDQQAVMLFFLGQHVISLVCFLIAGFVIPVRPAWRLMLAPLVLQNLLTIWLFAGMLLGNQWRMFGALYPYVNLAIHVMGIFTLLLLATWDYASTRDRRDWLHWLGIVIMLIWDVPTLILQLRTWL
ncbi:hypothetical protein C5Y96_12460 [Blastopirellula marina]|uniref:Uncharacterized protein n=1 Tax=Blastopirellula marina TaxID=124 RepID=A0A2S8FG55_9BACT|nr:MULTISPECIES: hypothetical protein [Pirellulaceae]PQO31158.1 hypothetical protein C5Y96_12460 [Blastopirellula marina]RCS51552.1 hypothetical protein DTL36_12470 [Bremerella cremea]